MVEQLVAGTMFGGCIAFFIAALWMAVVWPDDLEAIAFGMLGSCYLWFICHGIAAFAMLYDKS